MVGLGVKKAHLPLRFAREAPWGLLVLTKTNVLERERRITKMASTVNVSY